MLRKANAERNTSEAASATSTYCLMSRASDNQKSTSTITHQASCFKEDTSSSGYSLVVMQPFKGPPILLSRILSTTWFGRERAADEWVHDWLRLILKRIQDKANDHQHAYLKSKETKQTLNYLLLLFIFINFKLTYNNHSLITFCCHFISIHGASLQNQSSPSQ